jgi:flagellar basal-body rod protein FlgB
MKTAGELVILKKHLLLRNDGNGVDLEREMVALTKNASMFQALITFQSRQNQQIKGVLAEQ